MRKGQHVRVKTEDLISELLRSCGWSRSDWIVGIVDENRGSRVCVQVNGRLLWFDDGVLESDFMQPGIPGIEFYETKDKKGST